MTRKSRAVKPEASKKPEEAKNSSEQNNEDVLNGTVSAASLDKLRTAMAGPITYFHPQGKHPSGETYFKKNSILDAEKVNEIFALCADGSLTDNLSDKQLHDVILFLNHHGVTMGKIEDTFYTYLSKFNWPNENGVVTISPKLAGILVGLINNVGQINSMICVALGASRGEDFFKVFSEGNDINDFAEQVISAKSALRLRSWEEIELNPRDNSTEDTAAE